MVVVEADSVSRASIDGVLVTIAGSRDAAAGTVTNVDYGAAGLPLRFPLRVAVVPEDGDVERTLSVRVAGLQAGSERVVASASTGFVENRVVVLRLVLGAACLDRSPACPNGQTCDPFTGACTDAFVDPGELPDLTDDAGVFDGGARIDAQPLDAGCVEGTRCEAGSLITCLEGVETPLACTGMCGERDMVAACLDLTPRNVVHPGALSFSGGAVLSWVGTESVLFDSQTGEITVDGGSLRAAVSGENAGIHFVVTPQAAGDPVLASFAFESLTLGSGATIRVTGPNAVALLSNGDVLVDGRIDVSASGSLEGSGGYAPRLGMPGLPASAGGDTGLGVVVEGVAHGTGGGGGGGGGTGGAGGDDDRDLVVVRGGRGGPNVILGTGEPLVGGASGGGCTAALRIPSDGGAGGGAIQVFSRTSIEITVSGVIAAHGGGGATMAALGGSGGGAGGMILLEAPSLVVNGGVFANGGSGAGGTYLDEPAAGGAGRDGVDGRARQTGGPGDSGGGAGGAGGAGDVVNGGPGIDGLPRTSGTSTGGGGGGAAGRLYFATDGPFTPGGVTSPGALGQVGLPLTYR